MKLEVNHEKMKIKTIYERTEEWKRVNGKRGIVKHLMALRKVNLLEYSINENLREVEIICSDRKVFEHILKGFRAVQ